jgi:hypothetical protein
MKNKQALRQAQRPEKAKVVEPIEIEDWLTPKSQIDYIEIKDSTTRSELMQSISTKLNANQID